MISLSLEIGRQRSDGQYLQSCGSMCLLSIGHPHAILQCTSRLKRNLVPVMKLKPYRQVCILSGWPWGQFLPVRYLRLLGGTRSMCDYPWCRMTRANPWQVLSRCLHVIWLLGAALAPNFAGQLAFRFLAGICGSILLAIHAASTADLFGPVHRTLAWPIIALASFVSRKCALRSRSLITYLYRSGERLCRLLLEAGSTKLAFNGAGRNGSLSSYLAPR